jgi:hypothetical protein
MTGPNSDWAMYKSSGRYNLASTSLISEGLCRISTHNGAYRQLRHYFCQRWCAPHGSSELDTRLLLLRHLGLHRTRYVAWITLDRGRVYNSSHQNAWQYSSASLGCHICDLNVYWDSILNELLEIGYKAWACLIFSSHIALHWHEYKTDWLLQFKT